MGQVVKLAENETFDTLRGKQYGVKREIILKAAERIFARTPFGKVSLREIAREAGISHATIYRYFPDRQTLFVEAFLRGVRKIEANIRAIIDRKRKRTLEDVAESFVTFLFDHDHYFKMMSNFMLEGDVPSHLHEKINAIARSLMDGFADAFRVEGAEDVPRVTIHGFFSALNGILITFHDYPGRERADIRRHVRRLARLTAGIFRRGWSAS